MIRRLAGGLAALCLLLAPAVALAQPVSGQLTYSYNRYTNIPTTTTTLVRSGQGLFRGFCVNTAGTTSTLTAYDNTAASGTKIGTWTTTAVGCYWLDAGVTLGLTIVTGGTAGDITVFWR